MEQRVSDELLADLIAEHNSNIIRVADWCQLDLKDCRAEIKRLEALSKSQAEALDQMEQGKL